MFGYVKPLKTELRIKEFDTYKAIYCGLCKQLSQSFGFLARLTLNYDYTFLALLSMAMDDHLPQFARQGCVVNPLRKKACCLSNRHLEYSADIAMLILYHKVRDNCTDNPFLQRLPWYCALPFAKGIRKRAAKRRPLLDQKIAQEMENQSKLEKAGCTSVDQAAEPTGQILSAVFAELSENAAQKRVLSRAGYLLGRWIYLIDALDDLQEDLKNKSYNPFIALSQKQHQEIHPEKIQQTALSILNQTAAEIASGYELLELHAFRPILDNIIYLGLGNSVQAVLRKEEKK